MLCCMTNLGNSVIGSKSNSRQTRRTNPPSPLPPPITITLFIKLRRNCRIQIIMPSQDPGRRRPIPTRVKIIMTCIMLALSAGMVWFAVFVGKKQGFAPDKWPKPFGLGIGPAYIGERDTVWAGDDLVFTLYAAYRRFKLLTGQTTSADGEYYQR